MTIRKIYLYILIHFFLFGCKEKVEVIFDGQYKIIGDIRHDSIWEGEMKFYDLDNRLVAKKNYRNNVLMGPSLRYNIEGIVIDSVNFIEGKKTGLEYVYNDAGEIIQIQNFFSGKEIGSTYTFDKGKIIEYSFNNFENKVLYYSSFDSKTREYYFPDDIYLANASIHSVTIDGKYGVNIFLYLILPPKLRLNHCIYKYDSLNNVIDSSIVPHKGFYFEKFFPVENNEQKFAIHIHKYDSLLKKETIIVKNLALQPL